MTGERRVKEVKLGRKGAPVFWEGVVVVKKEGE